MRIFHLVAPDAWAAAAGTGEYWPDSLRTEGFVHFSFAEQVAGTANLLYADARALLVQEFDPADLAPELRIEDTHGTGTEFPHVYGPVPTSAALAEYELTRGADGAWRFTPGGAAASASPDR